MPPFKKGPQKKKGNPSRLERPIVGRGGGHLRLLQSRVPEKRGKKAEKKKRNDSLRGSEKSMTAHPGLGKKLF